MPTEQTTIDKIKALRDAAAIEFKKHPTGSSMEGVYWGHVQAYDKVLQLLEEQPK